jgi:hypothetical protein
MAPLTESIERFLFDSFLLVAVSSFIVDEATSVFVFELEAFSCFYLKSI